MKKLIIFITLISFFGFSQNLEYSDPDLQGISKDRIERITELSKSYVNNNKVANVTTIINRNGNEGNIRTRSDCLIKYVSSLPP